MKELNRIKNLKEKYEIIVSTLGENYDILDIESDYKQVMMCKAIVKRYKRKLHTNALKVVKTQQQQENNILNTLMNKGKVSLFNGGVC